MPYRYVPIEKKHTYQNFSATIGYRNTFTSAAVSPKYPDIGMGTQDRIGDKISPSSLVLDFSIQHESTFGAPFKRSESNYDVCKSVSGTFTNGTGTVTSTSTPLYVSKPFYPWSSNFRLFVVETEADFVFGSGTDYIQWFKNNWVYYGASGAPVYTNQSVIMRESTDDTGQFKIIFDHQFKLSSSKPIYNFNKTIPLKGQFTFTAATGDVPSSKQYFVIIIPPLSQYDFDTTLLDYNGNSGAITARWVGVFKLNYTDI